MIQGIRTCCQNLFLSKTCAIFNILKTLISNIIYHIFKEYNIPCPTTHLVWIIPNKDRYIFLFVFTSHRFKYKLLNSYKMKQNLFQFLIKIASLITSMRCGILPKFVFYKIYLFSIFLSNIPQNTVILFTWLFCYQAIRWDA